MNGRSVRFSRAWRTFSDSSITTPCTRRSLVAIPTTGRARTVVTRVVRTDFRRSSPRVHTRVRVGTTWYPRSRRCRQARVNGFAIHKNTFRTFPINRAVVSIVKQFTDGETVTEHSRARLVRRGHVRTVRRRQNNGDCGRRRGARRPGEPAARFMYFIIITIRLSCI